MAKTDIGRAVPLLKGEYNPATTYELNDIVSLNGSLYWHYSHEETTNVAPQATSTWKVVLSLVDAEAYIARAETAAGEAEDAKDAALAAQTAAETASTTAVGASATATAARNDAVTAKTAAETAQAGAVSAKNDAVTAKEAAQTAASSAGTSATNANNSAGTAQYYAESAGTSASTATTKAGEASASASTASTAATTATTKASEASASATTATTKAGEASTSATSAASSAAAAQAVKDSIPEDYSQLSNDVSDLKTQLTFFDGNFKKFHVNANTAHSADNDRLSVNITSGEKYIIVFTRTYTNTLQFWAYGSTSTKVGGTAKTNGYVIITAEADINYIGVTVSAYSQADDYSFAVITEKEQLYKFYETVDCSIKNGEDIAILKDEVDITTNNLFNFSNKTPYISANGWRLNDSDGNSHADDGYTLVKYNVTPGDVLYITSDDKFQFQSSSSVPSTGANTRIGITYDAGHFIAKVPTGALYLIVSTPTSSNHSVKKCSTKLDDTVNMYDKSYSTEPHVVHVNANAAHSADNDRLPVNIKQGDKFVVNYHRNYTNTLQFWAYTPEGTPNYSLFGTSKKFGAMLFVAKENIEYIGVTVTSNSQADDYYYIVSGEDSVFYQNELNNNAYARNYDYKSKTAQFAALYKDVGIAESYVYFTDPHLLSVGDTESFKTLFDNYTKVIEGFYKRTSTEYVLCGGDWLEWSDTPEDALYKLNTMQGRMKEIAGDLYYPVMGNHDSNEQGSVALSQSAINATMFPMQGKAYYKFTTPNCYHYVLDTGTDRTTAMDSYRWEQIDWLAKSLKDDDNANNVIIGHIIRNVNTAEEITPMMQNVNAVIGAYNGKTSVTLNGITYDFTNCTGRVWYVLGGHGHIDRTDYSYNVPFIIRTTTKALSSDPTFDLALCDFTNEKLYFVRIGSGAASTAEIIDLS